MFQHERFFRSRTQKTSPSDRQLEFTPAGLPDASPTRRPPLRKIGRLLLRHLRAGDRGKRDFAQAGAALDAAIALGAPLGHPIPLPDGRTVTVRDQFAGGRNTAFSAKMFQRFRVENVPVGRAPAASRPLGTPAGA